MFGIEDQAKSNSYVNSHKIKLKNSLKNDLSSTEKYLFLISFFSRILQLEGVIALGKPGPRMGHV